MEITRVVDLTAHIPPNKWVARLWESQLREADYLKAAVALGDMLALVVLNYLARPRRFALQLPKLELSRTGSTRRAAFNDVRHPLLGSAVARSLHRRFAVHDWRAAAVAALGIAGLSVWLCVGFRADAATVLSTVLALLPGVLVAIGWRERWSILEFESLYPVSRRQFITDTAVGLLFDAAEFWLTTVVAALVVSFILRMPGLHNPRFAESLIVGAMMQFVWVGGVFFIGQRRQTVSYIAGLAPFAVAIFATIAAVWRQSQSMPIAKVMLIALAEAAAGIAMLVMTWAFLQRRPRAGSGGAIDFQPAV